MWTAPDDFDFDGAFIKLKKVRAKPKPYGGTQPVIMNAGASRDRPGLCGRNCDAFFMQASRTSVDETRAEGGRPRRPQRRRTAAPLERVHGRCHHLPADHEGGRGLSPPLRGRAGRLVGGRSAAGAPQHHAADGAAEEFAQQRANYAHGNSGVPIVGDPDHIARQLIELSRAGLSGIAVSLVNYADELPYFRAEVLPRLERAGLRLPA